MRQTTNSGMTSPYGFVLEGSKTLVMDDEEDKVSKKRGNDKRTYKNVCGTNILMF